MCFPVKELNASMKWHECPPLQAFLFLVESIQQNSTSDVINWLIMKQEKQRGSAGCLAAGVIKHNDHRLLAGL